MTKNTLIPHLFRSEYSKIVAVLCKTYGLSTIDLAQDIVSETFLKATETWGLKGIPENPSAWLYTVAKNKTKDYFKREKIYTTKIETELKNNSENIFHPKEIDLSPSNITDSELQMLFTVCNPILSNQAQIALALRVLCGFGVDEIANALLSTKSTINKRLFRAKEKFRKNNIDLAYPASENIDNRLDNVLYILYLLFNEGYHSSTVEKTIRKDLCLESMRLLLLLINNDETNKTKTNALMALFCFHSSRFDARTNEKGEPILYEEQDKNKWIPELIEKGEYYLQESAQGNSISKYHIEASIAYCHTQVNIDEKKKWDQILQLYNRLLQVEYSPIAALNRTYALAKSHGNAIALQEALKIDLKKNYLYHSLLAELYIGIDTEKQLKELKTALTLAPTKQNKNIIAKKISQIIPI